ncbi:uncharacterized protein PGTG_00787 [Puccinia graminis f. sp. tritici CRL 75-36-700-3]|uniref:Uncharacterized protein n=1 Tax=Puccinia graminis f. sp. tritici (strain CRL 75-36-700-3 / race SCCL) TaxID=418459 RepID=E3JTQ5_PUCGT|nr:uncharacterized protein PGTG_00787 [Puccinia graminis f. sp. tritici CRL 75-36-700-3]EFP75456.2 hypothetical protein PGTG_00787 [Puccinia graminis f. sp. tritici CRL 75-36-700-3]
MSCKPAGLQSLESPPPPYSPFFSPSIGFSVPQSRRPKKMRGASTFLPIVRGLLAHNLPASTRSCALVGQVVDRGKPPPVSIRSYLFIGQHQNRPSSREIRVRPSSRRPFVSWPAGVRVYAATSPLVNLPIVSSARTMPRFNKHTPAPRASNPYPLRSRMSLPEPSSPLERGRVLGSPIQLDSRESSRPPILNASPIAPPSLVRGQAAGSPIEIDSQGSAPRRLADPSMIARPVSPKATRASRAARVPPGLVGLLPQDQGGASPPYQHCPTPLLDPNPPFPPQSTPEWRRPASNSRGSSNSPVVRRPFEVAESSLHHLSSLLSSNRAVIEEPWTLPPAPRPRNLSTPSDIRSAVDVAPPTSTSASQEESATADEDELESSSSQHTTSSNHTASSNQSYPFARQHRVASPDPPGFYDVDEFHLLRDHQIDSLLSRRADPARFDRYAFCPREFTAFYQSAASGFVAYCNAERPSCPRDQAHRVSHFKFLNRSYMSLRRHFRHLD